MLTGAKKYFLFLTLYYLVVGIVNFIIILPETLLAFKALLEQLPLCLTTFLIYLVLKDIEERITRLEYYSTNDKKELKEKITKQERSINQLLSTTKALKEEIEKLKNKKE